MYMYVLSCMCNSVCICVYCIACVVYIVCVKNRRRFYAAEEMICACVYVCVCERESRDTRCMTQRIRKVKGERLNIIQGRR